MIERVGRRIASAFDRSVGSAGQADGEIGEASPPPTVEFLAYGEDCLLVGRVRLDGVRITDLLNEHDEYEIRDLVAERLSDGHAAGVPALVVARHELLLVQAVGPRGDATRRLRTSTYPVAAQVGPYRVRGQLHAMHGVDPEVVIHRRAPMVPLTEAWVDRPLGDERDLHRLGTVILNRDRMDWVVATWEDSSRWLDDRPLTLEPTAAR